MVTLPYEILFVFVMRNSDWQITVILLTKLYCLFFVLFENINNIMFTQPYHYIKVLTIQLLTNV